MKARRDIDAVERRGERRRVDRRTVVDDDGVRRVRRNLVASLRWRGVAQELVDFGRLLAAAVEKIGVAELRGTNHGRGDDEVANVGMRLEEFSAVVWRGVEDIYPGLFRWADFGFAHTGWQVAFEYEAGCRAAGLNLGESLAGADEEGSGAADASAPARRIGDGDPDGNGRVWLELLRDADDVFGKRA